MLDYTCTCMSSCASEFNVFSVVSTINKPCIIKLFRSLCILIVGLNNVLSCSEDRRITSVLCLISHTCTTTIANDR